METSGIQIPQLPVLQRKKGNKVYINSVHKPHIHSYTTCELVHITYGGLAHIKEGERESVCVCVCVCVRVCV